MIQTSTTGTDEQTSSAQNSKQDPSASKGMRARTALRLPYEPGSLNAKQWLRSLKNRERL